MEQELSFVSKFPIAGIKGLSVWRNPYKAARAVLLSSQRALGDVNPIVPVLSAGMQPEALAQHLESTGGGSLAPPALLLLWIVQV